MRSVIFLVTFVLAAAAFAQNTPQLNPPKRIPAPSLTLTDVDRNELTTGIARLRADIDALSGRLAADPKLLALLPDVEIFHKAVDWALRYDEFMAPKEIAFARHL